MKYVEEFRYGDLAKKVIKQIIAETDPKRAYKFLDFCSCHAHPIHRYGLTSVLPENITLTSVNRQPAQLIDAQAIDNTLLVATQPYVICCSYPELLTSNLHAVGNLVAAKAAGADIRIVYTIDDAINLAKLYPAKQVVFLAVGFEGEMLNTAVALKQAYANNLHNFSVIIEHKTAFNAACEVFEQTDNPQQATGLLLPFDIMENGIAQYHALQVRTKLPILVSGFEPVDILQSILYLIRQNNARDNSLICQFRHTVATKENETKQALLAEVFSNQCDPATAPIALQAKFAKHAIIFSDSLQAMNFFQAADGATENIQVSTIDPQSNQLQQ